MIHVQILQGFSKISLRTALAAWLLATGAVLQATSPLLAQSVPGRSLELQRFAGSVTIQTGQNRQAQIGDRLSASGHGATTGPRSRAAFAVDTGIGTITMAQESRMTVQRLVTLADGAQVTILTVPRGQARVQVRSFSNPNSRLELHTPSGVAAVRGTDFGVSVSTDGKTAIATAEGRVEASAESVAVSVEPGFASVIRPGEPPTLPLPLDRELEIRWQSQERRGRRVRLWGQINPANTLLIADQEVPVDRQGRFDIFLPNRHRHRTIPVMVQNPLGEVRDHGLAPWQLPDLDRSGSH